MQRLTLWDPGPRDCDAQRSSFKALRSSMPEAPNVVRSTLLRSHVAFVDPPAQNVR